MCGRFGLGRPDEVQDRFDAMLLPEIDEHQLLIPRFNIAPSQDVLAVALSRQGDRVIQPMRWGLIQSWMKNPKAGPRPINIRTETILDRAHLRGLLERRRCIIPSDGFYEWQTFGKKRLPWHFGLAGLRLFGFAGLYDVWRAQEGWQLSCTILTTSANNLVARLHDRMPVILEPYAERQWLDPAAGAEDLAHACFKPLPEELMETFAVLPLVNDVRNEGPELRTRATETDCAAVQAALFG